MERTYSQLSLEERIEIYKFQQNGMSLRGIARAIGRCASTISREIKRNGFARQHRSGGYVPVKADKMALRRRQRDKRYKLERQPALRKLVYNLLVMEWSPEQIAGRLAREHGRTIISYESIYRYAYYRTAQKDYWCRLLPRKKYRRGHTRRGGISPALSMKHRVSVHERSETADNRREPGHWESDFMLFSKYGQAVIVTHERTSRILLANIQSSKKACQVLETLKQQLGGLPPTLLKTIAFDNGTENAYHYKLRKPLGIKTYFCDVRSPWQKGGVENAIGRLRRRLPRKSDMNKIPQSQLDEIIRKYNNTPRKCLAYKTPAEVFYQNLNLLHFKRESIYPPARVRAEYKGVNSGKRRAI